MGAILRWLLGIPDFFGKATDFLAGAKNVWELYHVEPVNRQTMREFRNATQLSKETGDPTHYAEIIRSHFGARGFELPVTKE